MRIKQDISVEVCAYSLISCLASERAGADRVELCASPWEGGTTPSQGLVESVLSQTKIEVHAMLRPRGGDFCYDTFEKATMLAEAKALIAAGVHGLVVGALLPDGSLDSLFLAEIRGLVGDLPLTCHRAIDVSRDPIQVMEDLISLGFRRILTSGQKDRALDGLEQIAEMVQASDDRIEIMAGSGVNPHNCQQFLQIGVNAVHLSARTTRESDMDYRRPGISMGGVAAISEFEIAYASEELIRETVQKVRVA
jgi:copper homeostasis protein